MASSFPRAKGVRWYWCAAVWWMTWSGGGGAYKGHGSHARNVPPLASADYHMGVTAVLLTPLLPSLLLYSLMDQR